MVALNCHRSPKRTLLLRYLLAVDLNYFGAAPVNSSRFPSSFYSLWLFIAKLMWQLWILFSFLHPPTSFSNLPHHRHHHHHYLRILKMSSWLVSELQVGPIVLMWEVFAFYLLPLVWQERTVLDFVDQISLFDMHAWLMVIHFTIATAALSVLSQTY